MTAQLIIPMDTPKHPARVIAAAERVYEQVKALALPHIEAFHNDLLKHDRRALVDTYPGTPFLHFTRECGTWVIMMPPAGSEAYPPEGEKIPYLFSRADRWHILAQIMPVFDSIERNRNTRLLLYFDGNRLHKASLARAKGILEEYVDGVQRTWRDEIKAAERRRREWMAA
jgi:hypothetical protein